MVPRKTPTMRAETRRVTSGVGHGVGVDALHLEGSVGRPGPEVHRLLVEGVRLLAVVTVRPLQDLAHARLPWLRLQRGDERRAGEVGAELAGDVDEDRRAGDRRLGDVVPVRVLE